MSFTLHTELTASVPEFTISCLTHGGPASTVSWTVDGVKVKGSDIDHETNQVILDTLHNSVYDNRLRVRGRRAGTYYCTITGSTTSLARSSKTITGYYLYFKLLILLTISYSCRTAHQTEDSHLWLQHYTCECECVLGVTRRRCQWLYDLLPD